jgi:hypothetical protein
MLKRERVINILHSLGFSFKRQCPNVDMYKKGTDRLTLPRNALIDPDWLRATLSPRGVPRERIEEMIRSASV